jgi:hypothetical protein
MTKILNKKQKNKTKKKAKAAGRPTASQRDHFEPLIVGPDQIANWQPMKRV